MQLRHTRLLLSASDLVAFHECGHLTQLDRRALDDAALRAQRNTADEQALLIQRKGNEFEAGYLARLEREHPGLVRIEKGARALDDVAAETLAAMRAGAPIIYQATFLQEDLLGHADFLRRVERASALGEWSYEVIDTKLARSEKPKFVLQLAFYSELLAAVQGCEPQSMHVVLGTGEEVSYHCADYSRYFRRLLQRFRAALEQPPEATYPDPCERCSICHWREYCDAQRERDDSLWLVAGMRGSQVQKLQSAGIRSLTQLAQLPPARAVATLAQDSLAKLRGQAMLQLAGRGRDDVLHEMLPVEAGRGLARLPAPDLGDVYFDMEGDPLQEGGLEYLFGVLYREDEAWQFRAFWAHGRRDERLAFEQFMDWLAARIAQYPALHVYHYAAYENSALKRLAGQHATREDALDELLRAGRLVDLYRVVREALRVSTPSYSIKHIECLYRPARGGEVQTAAASIVYYERYLETQDAQLLEDIERYNEDDCRSAQQLHAWLLEHHASDASATATARPGTAAPRPISEKLAAYLETIATLRAQLLASVPDDPAQREPADHARALMADVLEFHRRAEKPQWWEMFARADLELEELLEDLDAIGGLERVPGSKCEYSYPAQEHRFKTGDRPVWVGHPESATVKIEFLDEARRRIVLAGSRKSGDPPERLHLGATGPIDTRALKEAVLSVGRSIVAGDQRYAALEGFLEKRLPRLAGRAPGSAIVADAHAPMAQIIEAVAALDRSHLFIQGPPGAGKTYTGSHLIVELLARGKRVAVSSNSHKAINNLLQAVDRLLIERGLAIRAVKKSTEDMPDTHLIAKRILNVFSNDEALDERNQLVGGTAWLFSSVDTDPAFDTLFVDEAGQVSLGHLLAMGTSARNLVLLGDQMQLGQPIQGTHPGRSGESALEYLLDGRATVPPEEGVFLPTTWRMCPDVCRFISEAVYDARLEPEPQNARQRLVLAAGHHAALQPTGLVFLPMDHVDCAQKCDQEALAIRELYLELLQQRWINREGEEHPITTADILIVAPYNLQVIHLARTLPAGARVGTVDKFQGQEAAVVLVSMTTSSEDDLPRNIDFLFSRNRLNVAISRARCLSVVLANPRLLDTRCTTVAQIGLVNTLCWVAEVGVRQAGYES